MKNELMISGLEKALDELFKAQDLLSKVSDQGGDAEYPQLIEGWSQRLRELQREVSQAIYRLGKSR